MSALDDAPLGSIATIGNPINAVTARKRGDGVWAYTASTVEVEYDDLHKTAQIVWSPPTGTVDPKREVPEDEVKALVAIEATERLINRALREVRTKTKPDIEWVELLLTEAADVTTSRTCTAVKSLFLSSRISLDADLVVDRCVKAARTEQARARLT